MATVAGLGDEARPFFKRAPRAFAEQLRDLLQGARFDLPPLRRRSGTFPAEAGMLEGVAIVVLLPGSSAELSSLGGTKAVCPEPLSGRFQGAVWHA